MILGHKYRFLFYVLLAFGVGVCMWLGSRVQFSHEIDDFFPENDPDYTYFNGVKDKFEQGHETLIIGISHDSSVFEADFLRRFDAFVAQLDTLKGNLEVSSMLALSRSDSLRKEHFFIEVLKDSIVYDTTLLFQYPDVHPKFISPDKRSTCLYIQTDSILDDNYVEQLQSITTSFHFHHAYFLGHQISQDSYEKSLKSEMILLASIALCIIALIIFLAFRSLKVLVISILFVTIVLIFTIGFMALINAPFNVLTITIPSIVAIVSISDLIHVFSRLNEENGNTSIQVRIKATYSDITKSLFLTSLTTAIGFVSMVFTKIGPFIDFGIIITVGILFAFVFTLLLLPELIMLFFRQQHSPPLHFQSPKFFKSAFKSIIRIKIPIAMGTLVLLGVGFFYGSKVNVNTYLYDDMGDNNSLSQSLSFFEKNFFGIRDLNIYFETKDGKSLMNTKQLRNIEAIENYLYDTYKARDVYGVTTLMRRYNRIVHYGNPDDYIIPQSDSTTEEIVNYLKNEPSESHLFTALSKDEQLTQLAVKTTDEGSHLTKSKNTALIHFLNKNIDPHLQWRMGSQSYFLDRSNEMITHYLFMSLLTALGIILVIIGVLFKSIKMALISLIPNILPLLCLLILMYFTDISLKKSTAVVFTIAFGIAVDDTIHFLSRLHAELRKGATMTMALEHTFISTGKAILITSLVLIGGFGTLMFSSFSSTLLTGTLISIALFIAVIADLVVLPSLIKWLYHKG